MTNTILAPRSLENQNTDRGPTAARNPATEYFLEGFDAATRAATRRGTRGRGTGDWRGSRGQALLNWRTTHAHLGYKEQAAGLAEVRRGWDTAVALRRGLRTP
ncbi:hypothetical protein [Mycetocola spongiae]|uniref:hypothetical protein n=1 Tax=Mycetocola spongiae TaxID=2859226 RepID=UPI001CF1E67A|nr:hypothetical protein [Mycetocola spongiae]UCR89861.1 hypothetical protein KXZ72_04110 [Mycetocola spongiae]